MTEFFKWLIAIAIRLKKTNYPRTRWGTRACIFAVLSYGGSIAVGNMEFEDGYFIKSIDLAAQEATFYGFILSACLFLVGVFLIYADWKSKTRHIAKAFISLLPGMPNEFPEEVLDPTESEFTREGVIIGGTTEILENYDLQVDKFNAEKSADVFKRFIIHDKAKQLYFGGLARVPILYAYGTLLRNVPSKVIYFDKFHKDGNYKLLDDVNQKVKLADYNLPIDIQNKEEVGVAIGFTTPINPSQLPPWIVDATIYLSPSSAEQRNIIKSQENLEGVSEEIISVLDEISSFPGCKRVHLFLSVQSTLAIELGRRYQEGIHKNVVVHNYLPEESAYNWRAFFEKGELRRAINE